MIVGDVRKFCSISLDDMAHPCMFLRTETLSQNETSQVTVEVLN